MRYQKGNTLGTGVTRSVRLAMSAQGHCVLNCMTTHIQLVHVKAMVKKCRRTNLTRSQMVHVPIGLLGWLYGDLAIGVG